MEELGRRFSWASLPLVATIARLLCKELTLQVEYLRKEVEVLRSRVPGRLRFTNEERRSLVDAALAMGRRAMEAVVSLVRPETILGWQRKLEQRKWDYSKRQRRGPRKPGEMEELVRRLARENAWGYRRISGELAKQGIAISKSCIADILRRHGLPPSSERKGLTWREFLRQHADVLLCADLFTKEVWTFCGLQRAFVLVVMHLRSRTILLAEVTFSPHAAWMAQQVRNVLWVCEDLGIRPRFLLHDRDRCFCNDLDTVLRSAGVEPLKTPYHAPNANAFAERWIRSARFSSIPRLLVWGVLSYWGSYCGVIGRSGPGSGGLDGRGLGGVADRGHDAQPHRRQAESSLTCSCHGDAPGRRGPERGGM